jgi:hypothetical protein
VHEIGAIDRQDRVAAGKLDAGSAAGKGQVIAKIDRLHDGFQFMKTIGTFAEDVEEEVNLAGGWESEAHSIKQNAPT